MQRKILVMLVVGICLLIPYGISIGMNEYIEEGFPKDPSTWYEEKLQIEQDDYDFIRGPQNCTYPEDFSALAVQGDGLTEGTAFLINNTYFEANQTKFLFLINNSKVWVHFTNCAFVIPFSSYLITTTGLFIDNSSNVILEKCFFHEDSEWEQVIIARGLVVRNCQNIILNTTIMYNLSYGILLIRSVNCVIQNSQILDFFTYGILFDNSTELELYRVDFHTNWERIGSSFGPLDVWDCETIRISECKFFSGPTGVNFFQCKTVIFEKNMIYAYHPYGFYLSNCSEIELRENIFHKTSLFVYNSQSVICIMNRFQFLDDPFRFTNVSASVFNRNAILYFYAEFDVIFEITDCNSLQIAWNCIIGSSIHPFPLQSSRYWANFTNFFLPNFAWMYLGVVILILYAFVGLYLIKNEVFHRKMADLPEHPFPNSSISLSGISPNLLEFQYIQFRRWSTVASLFFAGLSPLTFTSISQYDLIMWIRSTQYQSDYALIILLFIMGFIIFVGQAIHITTLKSPGNFLPFGKLPRREKIRYILGFGMVGIWWLSIAVLSHAIDFGIGSMIIAGGILWFYFWLKRSALKWKIIELKICAIMAFFIALGLSIWSILIPVSLETEITRIAVLWTILWFILGISIFFVDRYSGRRDLYEYLE